ncbi:MAG TPA: uracil-DNA glycosylase family protein [Steroidobacteraceae bacterium]|nr:uracil-DNA glycosylase family protein [Steroidobacteraceae bacterium]
MLNATQTVFGARSQRARVVLVGEQPGDQEDRSGEPFVGPAGKLLDRALTDAAIDRKATYVTNAVKHFNWRSARVISGSNASSSCSARHWSLVSVRPPRGQSSGAPRRSKRIAVTSSAARTRRFLRFIAASPSTPRS